MGFDCSKVDGAVQQTPHQVLQIFRQVAESGARLEAVVEGSYTLLGPFAALAKGEKLVQAHDAEARDRYFRRGYVGRSFRGRFRIDGVHDRVGRGGDEVELQLLQASPLAWWSRGLCEKSVRLRVRRSAQLMAHRDRPCRLHLERAASTQ